MLREVFVDTAVFSLFDGQQPGQLFEIIHGTKIRREKIWPGDAIRLFCNQTVSFYAKRRISGDS
jgi:hypothetical protein